MFRISVTPSLAALPAGLQGQQWLLVDPRVADWETIVAEWGLPLGVTVLDPAHDGLAQWAALLHQQPGLGVLHVLAHGRPGQLQLGSQWVTQAVLEQQGDALREACRGLSANVEFKLYACELAQGETGRAFIDTLATLSGASVAAATHPVGADTAGGHWALDACIGPQRQASLAAPHYAGLLAAPPDQGFNNAPSGPVGGDNNNSFTLDGIVYSQDGSVDPQLVGTWGMYLGAHGDADSLSGTNYGQTGKDLGFNVHMADDVTYFQFAAENPAHNFRLESLFVEVYALIDGYFTQYTVSAYDDGQVVASHVVDFTNSGVYGDITYELISDGGGGQLTFGADFNNIDTVRFTGVQNGGALAGFIDTLDFSAPILDDNEPPVVSDQFIAISGASGTGGAFKVGDTVTATWNNSASGDNNGDVASVTVDFSQFGGSSAVVATQNNGVWTATYTLTAGAIDATNRNVSITATDNASNSTTTADTSNATVDTQPPTVTNAHIAISGASGTGGAFKVGDTVTATWNNTASGDDNSDTISGVTVNFSQFGGGSAVAAVNNAGTWTASYTLTAGVIDATNRNVSVTATDNAGNTTTTADTSNASVDTQAPAVSDAHIALGGASGLNGAFKVGDTVTATWDNTLNGDNNGDIDSVTVDFSQFGGSSAVVATQNNGVWTATYTLTAGAIDATNRNVSITATDNAGNATTATDTSNATVDTQPPVVSGEYIGLSGATGNEDTFKVGDTVTVTWNNAADGDNNSDTISGVTVDFSALGGGSAVVATQNGALWSATYTLVAGEIDATNLQVSVTARDDAGNATTVASSATMRVNTLLPVVSDAFISITGSSGAEDTFIIGDTVTATWDSALEEGAGEGITGVVFDFSQFGGGAAVPATYENDRWSATYTLTAGAIESTGLNVLVSATNAAGNTTTTADTSNASVDTQAPAVSDANIALGGASGLNGAFKVGDTVTATWDNTLNGDNNGDIDSVTVDFSQFGGGSAVVATQSNGVWTATYTLTAGALDATDRNVSITATDNAGNATTATDTSNATVDTQPPVVSGEYIGLSGATGNEDTFKVGDTVTVTWNNAADGDNNSDTISGVTVNFSALGGGSAVVATQNGALWSATYTLVAGEIDATNLQVSVTARDDAGNATTVMSSSVAVDTQLPGAPTGVLEVDENSPVGTVVGVLSGGGTDNVTYRLTDDAGGRFAVDPATGEVTVASPGLLDYETAVSHSITAEAVDDAGNATSAVLTVTVNDVDDDNRPPLLDTSSGEAAFVEDDGAVPIDDGLLLSDEDSATLVSATVSLVANFVSSEDRLSFTNDDPDMLGAISASYDAQTGVLTLTSNPPATLAQWQAALRSVVYENVSDTPSTLARSVTFVVNDGVDDSNVATREITVTASNDAPQWSGVAPTTSYTEGGVAVYVASQAMLEDPELTALADGEGEYAGAVLTVSRQGGSHPDDVLSLAESSAFSVSGGSLQTPQQVEFATFSSANGVLQVTFAQGATQALVNAVVQAVVYENDNRHPPASVTLDMVLNDGNTGEQGQGDALSSTASVSVQITPVNDPPEWVTPTALNMAENQTQVATLEAFDVDSETLSFQIQGGADAARFTIDPVSGLLSFVTAPNFEAPGDVGGDNVYEVTVQVSDDLGATALRTFYVTVTDVIEPPVNPGPVEPPVVTPPILTPVPGAPMPNTPSGATQVRETITNAGNQPGTVELVQNTGNQNLVTATLPGGVSLVHEGSRTATNSGQALADLIASIDAKNPGNLADQTSIASGWLQTLSTGTALDIRTLTFSGSSLGSGAITLNGVGGSFIEAFVIDTTGLPANKNIVLSHIDFVSLKGSAVVTGGSGNNVVIGDEAPQYIVLGPGDDVLYGGGGDDVIGSEGGNDRLFGNSGDDQLFSHSGTNLLHGGRDRDTAIFEGNRSDFTITQEFGVVTVTSENLRNTLINIEVLLFDDGEELLVYDESLEWITGLYFQALGRQADVSGVQFWAQQYANGASRADIAVSVLRSAELGLAFDEGDGLLDALYAGLFGRAADEQGAQYWSGQLASGVSAQEVVNQFMLSAEMREHDLGMLAWEFLV